MAETDRVLCVDGDREERERAAERLAASGFSVTTAGTADEAVGLLKEDPVDCVVSEYRLPDADGLSFFERIYPQRPGLVFVLHTAHGSEALAGDAVAAGADGYVPKSAGLDTLVDRVDTALLMRDRGVISAETPDGGTAGASLRTAGPSGADEDPDGTVDGPAGDLGEGARDVDVPGGEGTAGPAPRRIFESLGDIVYALDEEGYFTSVNGQLVSASGYTREELLGSHVTMLLDEADYDRGTEHLLESLEDGGDATTFEVDLIDKDGRRVPCEVCASAIAGPDGYEGTVGIVRDVTERERMERRLRERKTRIESLHRTALRLGDCRSESEIYETTVEAAERVLDIDGCAIHVVGPSGDRLLPHTWTGEDDCRTYTAPLDVGGSLQGAAYREDGTRRVDDSRGTGLDLGSYDSLLVVPVRGHGVFQAVSTEPGAFSAADAELAEILIAHVADALDRVDFEGQLRTERDRFAALFENVPDPVVDAAHDEEGPIVRQVNPAFERVFGYEGEDVVGRRLDEVIVPQDDETRSRASEINRRALEGEPVELEVQRRTTDGLRTFLLTVVPVEVEGENPRQFALYTDITERKQHRQRVEVLNRVLRHDLRNGMNVIETAADAATDHVDEPGLPYLTAIREKADELVGLADKTRTVQRTLDRERDDARPFDVVGAVEETVTDLQERFPAATLEVDAPARATVSADEFVEEAIHEVVENAVEHSDRDEPSVSVAVDADRPGRIVAVTVADDGPGIPDNERDLLLGDREITQLEHSSGLGLWLVNWIVTGTGGDLDIEEGDPRGTVVTLRLPAADEE